MLIYYNIGRNQNIKKVGKNNLWNDAQLNIALLLLCHK